MYNNIEHLIELSKKYGCDFYLPPFKKMKLPFFVINEIKDPEQRINFFQELDNLKIEYTYKLHKGLHCFLLANIGE